MRRILFWVPGFELPIYAYGFMLMVGFILAILLASRRAKERGMDPATITDLALYLVVFGVAGARVFYIIEFHHQFSFALFNVFDGLLSVVGLLIGAAASFALFYFRTKFAFLKAFHSPNRRTYAFFIIVGLLITLASGRLLYLATDDSVLYHRVVLRPRDKFYPDSLRRKEMKGGAFREIGVVSDKSSPDFGKEKEFRRLYPADEDFEVIRKANRSFEVYPAWEFSVFEVWKGGLVYYGGVIGGILAGLLFCWRRRIPFFKLADVVAPAIMLGLACGRGGCTLNGCCWGKIPDIYVTKTVEEEYRHLIGPTIPVLSYLTIRFPPAVVEEELSAEGIRKKVLIPAPPAQEVQVRAGLIRKDEWSLPVYATEPLHGAAALAIALLILVYGRKWKRYRGDEILLLGVTYPVGRFLVEFLRGDNVPEYLFGLTVSQAVGIFVIVGCAVFWFFRRRWLKKVSASVEV